MLPYTFRMYVDLHCLVLCTLVLLLYQPINWLVFQVPASPGAGVPQWGGGHRVHLGEGDIEYVSRHLELLRELYLELSRTI